MWIKFEDVVLNLDRIENINITNNEIVAWNRDDEAYRLVKGLPEGVTKQIFTDIIAYIKSEDSVMEL